MFQKSISFTKILILFFRYSGTIDELPNDARMRVTVALSSLPDLLKRLHSQHADDLHLHGEQLAQTLLDMNLRTEDEEEEDVEIGYWKMGLAWDFCIFDDSIF